MPIRIIRLIVVDTASFGLYTAMIKCGGFALAIQQSFLANSLP